MTAPDRVWLDWPEANKGDPVFDEPPEHDFQAGQTCYIRADLLAAPVTVHLNMLRGTIAKPSLAHIAHIYGDEWNAAIAEAEARGREQAAALMAQWADEAHDSIDTGRPSYMNEAREVERDLCKEAAEAIRALIPAKETPDE